MENQNVYTVYILHSLTLSKYYVGSTSMSVEARLKKHLSNHKGFTSKAKDWEVILVLEKSTKSEALKLERQIKKRGIKRWLEENK